MLKLTIMGQIDEKKMQEFAEKLGQEATKSISHSIFTKSQYACPVRSGVLKESGYMKEVVNGYEVGYSAAYADEVNARPQSELSSGQAHFFTNAINQTIGGK